MHNNLIANKKKNELLKTSFCLIIPMFNEENNVNQCVTSICKFLDGLDIECELLVVDDGSYDNTASELSILKKNYNNFNIETHTINKGYGVANRTGAFYALSKSYKYVLYMDADLTQDPKYINDFIKLMDKDIDFIKATRYSNGGGTDGVPFQENYFIMRKLYCKIFMKLPITDYTNGFRAIKQSF